MPTYEYVCESCGFKFEKFQQITAGAIRKCPSCSKLKLRRLIGTGAGIIFRGSGFYQTDYRSDGYRSSASKDSSSSTSSTSSTSKAGSETTAASESKSTTKKDDAASKAAG